MVIASGMIKTETAPEGAAALLVVIAFAASGRGQKGEVRSTE
jgi:hypothetical protein